MFKIIDRRVSSVPEITDLETVQYRFEGIDLDLERMDIGTENRLSKETGGASQEHGQQSARRKLDEAFREVEEVQCYPFAQKTLCEVGTTDPGEGAGYARGKTPHEYEQIPLISKENFTRIITSIVRTRDTPTNSENEVKKLKKSDMSLLENGLEKCTISDFTTSKREHFTFGEELFEHLVINLQLDELRESKYNMELATNPRVVKEFIGGQDKRPTPQPQPENDLNCTLILILLQ